MARKFTSKVINFDMDGTIANLYGVEGWLDDLENFRTRPYEQAKPLVNMRILGNLINKLQKKGYTVNIISWLSKANNTEYNRRVTMAKYGWLAKHLKAVKFDNIYIVPYGTPKHTLASGILFDDEIGNRKAWGYGAKDVYNILDELRALA